MKTLWIIIDILIVARGLSWIKIMISNPFHGSFPAMVAGACIGIGIVGILSFFLKV